MSNMHTHIWENNEESQKFLEENADKFGEQCLKIMRLLFQGKKLTVIIAVSHGITSLPRRIKDLRDRNNVTCIKDEWVFDGNGKKLYKQWFINIAKRPLKKEVVEKAKQQIDKSKPLWVQPDLL